MWEEKKNKENVSVRRKRIFAAILLYFCLLLFVANDAWVYQTPIVKITEVHTKESRKEEDVPQEKHHFPLPSATTFLLVY